MSNLTTKQKESFLTKKGEIRKIILEKFTNYSGEFEQTTYTGHYSGNGRFTTAHSFGSDFINFLNVFGLKYVTGNDAPRGGASGEFVKISSRAVSKLNKILTELNK